MYLRSRLDCLVMIAVVALLVTTCGAWAQRYGMPMEIDGVDGSIYSTPNLPGAEVWSEETTQVWGEVRSWEGENWTYAAGARTAAGEDMDAELTLFHMDTRGEDPIDGAVRDSEATLLGLNFRWIAHQTDTMTISVIPGAEFVLDDMKGTNTAIPATAVSDDLVPVFSVPFEFVSEQGTVYRAVPRYVGFDKNPRVDADTTIAGFGDVLAIGFGVLHEMDEFSVAGDVQFVVDGDNSIDENTNQPTDEFVWSAGGAWHGAQSDVRVDLFLTNAAGPTGATSIIATPDQSVGVGLRVSGEF